MSLYIGCRLTCSHGSLLRWRARSRIAAARLKISEQTICVCVFLRQTPCASRPCFSRPSFLSRPCFYATVPRDPKRGSMFLSCLHWFTLGLALAIPPVAAPATASSSASSPVAAVLFVAVGVCVLVCAATHGQSGSGQPVGEVDLCANGVGEVGDDEYVLDVVVAAQEMSVCYLLKLPLNNEHGKRLSRVECIRTSHAQCQQARPLAPS